MRIHCCKCDIFSQSDIALYGHVHPKPLNHRVEFWHDWLRPAHDPTCQNWYTPRYRVYGSGIGVKMPPRVLFLSLELSNVFWHTVIFVYICIVKHFGNMFQNFCSASDHCCVMPNSHVRQVSFTWMWYRHVAGRALFRQIYSTVCTFYSVSLQHMHSAISSYCTCIGHYEIATLTRAFRLLTLCSSLIHIQHK